MSPKQTPPTRLEAAYAALLLLRAELVARDKLIGELRAELVEARAALRSEQAFRRQSASAAEELAN